MPTVEMASDSDWQSTLSAMDRYDIIDRLYVLVSFKISLTDLCIEERALKQRNRAPPQLHVKQLLRQRLKPIMLQNQRWAMDFTQMV